MSRRGNYYDSAHTESFWRCFKAALLDGGHFPGLKVKEAKLEISYHVAYYNAEGHPLGLRLPPLTALKLTFNPRPDSMRLS